MSGRGAAQGGLCGEDCAGRAVRRRLRREDCAEKTVRDDWQRYEGREEMEYRVRQIETVEEIEECERFSVNHAQWNCVVQPETYGYMGYLKGKGLFVKMYCMEQNPKRSFKNHREKVWKDSAMEVFLAFTDPEGQQEITDQSLYLNFEINANGAMYAQYGYGRPNRQFVPERVYEDSGCRTRVEADHWELELLIPGWYLEELCGFRCEAGADRGQPQLYCNFYKISESPEIEHYLSFSEIESSTPNFHRPSCFARVRLEG